MFSLMHTSWLLLSFLISVPFTIAATVKYDFNVGWIWANPDGVFSRSVIGVNGIWPPPRIDATVGDTVVVDVYNGLGNQSTSIHFHGLFMNSTSHMDGTSFVSQCAISPGSSFHYEFKVEPFRRGRTMLTEEQVDQPGTYWYHSHEKSQYPDGLRGLLVVNDPKSPFRDQYDEEIVLSLSDWYHEQMPVLLTSYDKQTGMMARDPVPDSNLINDVPDARFVIQPGHTYLVRVVNIGAFVGQYFWIRDHTVTVVEVDGVYTKPLETDMIYLAAGQRYSLLLKARSSSSANFPIISRMDEHSFSMHSERPKTLDAVAQLVYGANMPLIEPEAERKLEPLDDLTIEPFDEEPLLKVDRSITLDIDMHTREDGIIHWMFNDQHYRQPALPSLFAAMSFGREALDPATYGVTSQTQVLEHGSVIEIVMRNKHMYPHPVHLHGHNFQVTHRSGALLNDTLAGQVPMRRDTIVVNGHGTLKFRFRADNPGVWLFHCHMEWHAHSGLMSTFVEAPLLLQEQLQGKVEQLSVDPQNVCQTSKVNNDAVTSSTSSTVEENGNSFALRVPPYVIALFAAALLLSVVLLGYIWSSSRKGARDAAYNLVPIDDADAGQRLLKHEESQT